MSGTSASVNHVPSGIAVRPKGLLLYDIGEFDRKEYQVVRIRKGHSSKGSMKWKSSLENEQQFPSGAGGPLSAEALQIEGAGNELLYVIVGVFLPDEKVVEAETLARDRGSKLETIQEFNMAVHGSSIAPKSTNPVRVVLPIWPNGENEDDDSHKKKRSIYHVLCNMENGLCEALPMMGGVRNPNFFFYPEWTRSGTDITRYKERGDEWTTSVRDWRTTYRRLKGSKGGPEACGSARDELPHGPGAGANHNLLPDQNEIPGHPASDYNSPSKDICQAMGLNDAAPKDAAAIDQIKDLLNPASPDLHALRMVMDGSKGVDLKIAEHAVKEFNDAFPAPDGNEGRRMSSEDLVQLTRGIQLMQQEDQGFQVE